MVVPYANVCVTGWPSIARSATRFPPSTVIGTAPFDGVAVSCPTKAKWTPRALAGPLSAKALAAATSATTAARRRTILLRIG